jgi:hypothetical protein
MINDTVEAVAPCLAAFDDARAQFIVYLDASGYSPNTARAYGHDLIPIPDHRESILRSYRQVNASKRLQNDCRLSH